MGTHFILFVAVEEQNFLWLENPGQAVPGTLHIYTEVSTLFKN